MADASGNVKTPSRRARKPIQWAQIASAVGAAICAIQAGISSNNYSGDFKGAALFAATAVAFRALEIWENKR